MHHSIHRMHWTFRYLQLYIFSLVNYTNDYTSQYQTMSHSSGTFTTERPAASKRNLCNSLGLRWIVEVFHYTWRAPQMSFRMPRSLTVCVWWRICSKSMSKIKWWLRTTAAGKTSNVWHKLYHETGNVLYRKWDTQKTHCKSSTSVVQGWFWACAQPSRDVVTK